MKDSLKQHVIGHLETLRLGEDQLRRLECLQAGGRPTREWWRYGIVAATILLLALTALVWLPTSPTDRTLQIADEVARNHLKQRPLEVHAGAANELQAYFDELGFRLQAHSRRLGSDRVLIGGRYCSIQGATAAQLRLRDGAGRVETLYQVPYDPGRFGIQPDIGRDEAPRTLQVRGLTVELWVERGLLFALTRE